MWAGLIGYFWIPCPSCGREFGGHEKPSGSIPAPEEGPYSGKMICAKCVRDGVGRRSL
jgi:hypothetical protein